MVGDFGVEFFEFFLVFFGVFQEFIFVLGVFAVFDVFEGFEEDFSDVVEFSVGGDEVEEVGGEFCVCGYFVKDQDSDSGAI